MSKNTTATTSTGTGFKKTVFTCSFEDIQTPGAYLEVETGRLFRITDDILAPGHSPMLSIVSNEPNTFVRLSDDPVIPISKARMTAANNDYWINF